MHSKPINKVDSCFIFKLFIVRLIDPPQAEQSRPHPLTPSPKMERGEMNNCATTNEYIKRIFIFTVVARSL